MNKDSQGEALSVIGGALRDSIVVPTDTMITDDIPLLLTKLSRVAYPPVPAAENPIIGVSQDT